MNKFLTITIISIFAVSAFAGGFNVHEPSESWDGFHDALEDHDPSAPLTEFQGEEVVDLSSLTELGEEDLQTQDPNSTASPETGFAADCLNAQNPFRTQLGIEPLTYSTELEKTAQAWADTLAGRNSLGHSPNRNRIGENLAMGSKGSYDTARLISLWTDEKKNFMNNNWPDVSTTGSWQDVAHYSQIVWRNTKEVGCALADNDKNTFIVCQYKPSGNWVGDKAY